MAYWRFWNGKSHELELSKNLKELLVSAFKMDTLDVPKIRYVRKKGRYAGRSVQYVCLYDPVAVPARQIVPRKYDSLCNQEIGVLFNGRVEKDGSICLVDRRPGQSSAK